MDQRNEELMKLVQGMTSGLPSNPAAVDQGLLHDLAGGAIEAVRSGAADLPYVIQKLSDVATKIAQDSGATDVQGTDVFKRLADAIDPDDFTDQPTLARKIGRVVGGLMTAIPKYAPLAALGPASIPAFGAVEGLTAWGRNAPPEEIAKATALGTAFGGLLKGGGMLARVPRMAALGTGAAGLEYAATGGEAKGEDLALTGITMATLGAMGGRLPHGLQHQLNKLGYPNEVIKGLRLKEARKIAREKVKFNPVTKTRVEPAAQTFESTDRELANMGYTEEQINAMPGDLKLATVGRPLEKVEPVSDLALNKILQRMGYEDEEVAAMPFFLKRSIVTDGYYADALKIDPITGQATIVGEPSKPIKFGTEQVGDIWGVKVPKVTELARTAEEKANTLEAVLSETSDKPTRNKTEGPTIDLSPEEVNEIKAAVVAEADKQGKKVGDLPPKEVAKIMRKAMSMRTRRMLKEKKQTKKETQKLKKMEIKEATTRIPDLAIVEGEPITREGLQRELARRINKYSSEGMTAEEIMAKEDVKFLQDEIATIPGGSDVAFEAGKKLTHDQAVIKLAEYKASGDQMLREQVEAFVGLPKTKSATYEQLVEMLAKMKPEEVKIKKGKGEGADRMKISRGKKKAAGAGIKAEAEEVKAKRIVKVEKVEEGVSGVAKPSDPVLVRAAAKVSGWAEEQLKFVDEKELNKIITAGYTKENASLSPTGKVTQINAGDKALATILGTDKSEVTAAPEVMREAQLAAATKWAEMSEKAVAALPEEQQNLLIESYLTDMDKRLPGAQKIGDQMSKSDVKSTQINNEALESASDTNARLARLEADAEAAKAEAENKKRLFEDDLIDKSEYDLAEDNKIRALTKLQSERTLLEKKTEQKVKKGGLEKIGIIQDRGSGGLLVRKQIAPGIDEWTLLNKDSRVGTSGESGVKAAGTVKLEIGEDRVVLKSMTDPFMIENSEGLRNKVLEKIRTYYGARGKSLRSSDPSVITLRGGLPVDLMKDMAARTRNKLVSIYRGFASRKGTERSVPRDEVDFIYKHMMEGQDKVLTQEDIGRMAKESAATPPPSAPAKGDIQVVSGVDLLGQSIANRQPDIRKVAESIAKYDIYKRKLKEMIIWNKGSKLNKIFEKILGQPNEKVLREKLADIMIRKTPAGDPIMIEAKEGVIKLMKQMADVNNLKERGFFVNEYFPLIADMEGTYKKIQGWMSNINERSGLPDRYKLADDLYLISQEDFNEVKYILQTRKNWKDLTNYQKNRIRYNVLSMEGIYDNWAYLPESVLGMVPKNTFNRHLQPRTGGGLLSYKHDAYDVLRSYLSTMIDKEVDNMMLAEVKPYLNKHAGENIIRSVRWYMSKQVKQALGTRTIGSMWIGNEIARLNDAIGREVINPQFPSILAGRVTGAAARGLLGPDTALRNIVQSVQTLVNSGPLPFAKALHKFITKKGLTEDEKYWFRTLLGAEEYTQEGTPYKQPLRERFAKATTKPQKVAAFYNWLGDMALEPMRATEHFNKFLQFHAALSEAAEKGWSFEKGIRVGLLRNMEDIPDLTIPHAYWEAYKTTLQSQYGYSRVMRNPLMRGPIAKMSTIFWSYPANTAQFIGRGLVDSALKGDLGRFTRFALYTGFQLTIATALLQLGYDVGAIFGYGLLPVSGFSVPWVMMKGAYESIAGKDAATKSKGADDFLNALGSLTVPQFRYGKKVLKKIKNLQDGYIAAGARELPVMETNPFNIMLDLMGFPQSGPKESYDIVNEARDKGWEYGRKKQDFVMKGIKALDKGDFGKLREIFQKAKDKNVILTFSEMSKYYRMHKTKTYLQTALERLPKHLRPQMQKKVEELERELMPHKFGMEKAGGATRPMWSGTGQWDQITEDQE